MSKCIITYAAGAHEELLDVALPTYKKFAQLYGYDLVVGKKLTDMPPAWNKIPLLVDALCAYEEVVWFDCDLVVVDYSQDFPPFEEGKYHSLVRHFEHGSEVPNGGVWRCRRETLPLLYDIPKLEVFTNHGWWEQAAMMTLMGYSVPPEGSKFEQFKCRCVHPTNWWTGCQFMRLCWNSHPNYRAEKPKIVHCSYAYMQERIEVMRALVRNPTYNYPRYNEREDNKEEGTNAD